MRSLYNYTSDCHIDTLKCIIEKKDFFDNERTENKKQTLYFLHTIKITQSKIQL